MPWVLPNLFHNNNVTTQIQNHYNYKNKKKREQLTGKRKSKASQAAWRTALVGYIGPPGEVKLYKHVFNLVLVVILSSIPA